MPGHVVVVGGGISGLTVAYHLQRHLPVTLVEASRRAGGKLLTQETVGFVLEGGAESFLLNRPELDFLLKDLDLEGDLDEVVPGQILNLRQSQLEEMPQGLARLLPPPLLAACLSSQVATIDKVLLLKDYLNPGEPSPGQGLTDPLLTLLFHDVRPSERGELTSDLLALESWHQGYLSNQHRPRRVVLREGSEKLIRRLLGRLQVPVLLGQPVRDLRSSQEGWQVILDDSTLQASAVVLAVPAPQAARLLGGWPELALALEKVASSGAVSLSMGFHRRQIRHPMPGQGFWIPGPSRHRLAACFWSTRQAPPDHLVLRAFLRTTAGILSGERCLQLALAELSPVLGISGHPVVTRVSRWPVAHALGPGLEAALPQGLLLAPAVTRGLGVGLAVAGAQKTAEQVLALLS